MILRKVVRSMSEYEKHDTWTANSISIAFKLTVARFVNTSIIPLIINSSFNSWIETGGLVSNIFYLILSVAFLDPFLYLINLEGWMKIFFRWL